MPVSTLYPHTSLPSHLKTKEPPSRLLRKLGLTNLVTPQDDIEHPLHRTEHLLVRRRTPPLEIGNDGRRGVALCSEVLLRHGATLVVLRGGAGLRDRLADLDADGFGLDDVVASVDFRQVLAFGAWA